MGCYATGELKILFAVTFKDVGANILISKLCSQMFFFAFPKVHKNLLCHILFFFFICFIFGNSFISSLYLLVDFKIAFNFFSILVKVIISAKEEPDLSITPAMDALLKVHKRLVEGLEGDQTHGPPNSGNVVLTRLLVAATQAGFLIGKQGSTIKSIQETCNSAVRVVGMDSFSLIFSLPSIFYLINK